MIYDLRIAFHKKYQKNLIILLVFLFILHTSYFILPTIVDADDMSSTSYKIQFGNFNITSGTKTSTSYKLTDTAGQTAAGQFGLTNNLVKSGFQYIYPFQKFTFKVPPQSINFCSLSLAAFSTSPQPPQLTPT